MTRQPARSRRRGRRSRGTLAFLAAVLAIGGAMRLGAGAETARESLTASEPAEATTSASTAGQNSEIEALLEALHEREARLDKREAALEERLRALALSEQRLDEQMREIEAAEAELSETLALADRASERDLARLTTLYESMKPGEAATLFEQMDPQFAAGFLARMQPERGAAVLAGLDPHTAYTISVILAGRHAEVPTE